ncbi:asparagine synthase (glutamine-hydrolyzing) [Balneolaceae bacterium]|nr:asparagine synthase (glutamine-hydrolyzing) [Balneolaceae bacterium]
MCGFNGFISRSNIHDLNYFNGSKKFIANRGPDSFEFCQFSIGENTFYFNHSRLAIIDLNKSSNQPFRKNGITLVFNGEIYNYVEIRNDLVKLGVEFSTNSDTEVVLESFRIWGVNCFEKFIGMFALAIHNIASDQIILARDRAGVKPLYFTYDDSQIVFSSDLYSLKYLSRIDLNLNHDSINRYFEIGYIDQNHTYLNDVQKVKSGTYIEFNLKTYQNSYTSYWNPSVYYSSDKILSEMEILEELDKLLSSSFDYRMISDVPVGVFLSGGYDSSIVSAILKKRLNHDITCYTIGFEEQGFNEAEYAKLVAKYLDVRHKVLYISNNDTREIIPKLVDVYDEPFGDSSAIPTLLVSKFAAKDVKVVLSADGGDEIFGGYHKYVTALKIYKYNKLLPEKIIDNLDIIPNEWIRMLGRLFYGNRFSLHHASKLKNIISQSSLVAIANALAVNPNSDIFNRDFKYSFKSPKANGINSMLLNDYQNYMEADILKKVDRATMYYSIEGREPLLDHRIFEFMASVNSDLKIKNYETKYLLKKLTHKYIPESIMNRPKMGFAIPLGKIIHEDQYLKEYFFDNISDEVIRNMEIFDLKKISEYKNMFKNASDMNFITLWYLFNFSNWFKKIKAL